MKRLTLLLSLLTLALCWGTVHVQAQTDKPKTIAGKMKAAVKAYEDQTKELEAQLRDGTLTKEEYEDRMEEASEAFEDQMEAYGEELGDLFDNDDDEDDDGEAIEIARDSTGNKVKINLKEKKSAKRTKSYFLLNFGPTYMVEGDIHDQVGQPDFEPWKSWSGNIGLMFSTRLGGEGSIAYVNYGVLWKYTYLEIGNDLRLMVDDGNPVYVPPSPYASTLDESQVSRQSLVIPLQFRFAGHQKKSLNVMVGGYGGLRLYGFQDLKFKSVDGEKANLRLWDDYATNQWLYGVTGAIGQRWWQLYADYELSNLFKDNPNYEYNLLNMGVQFFF